MKPVILIILDGWGYSPEERGNAVAMANTPNIDALEKTFLSGLLQASGITVGLPWEESGNSEVGHLSLGTGQIYYQPAVRISRQIESREFFKNIEFKKAVEHTRKFSSSLHLMGLLGSGLVHSRLEHINALLDFVKNEKAERVFLHFFMDGRDSPAKEGVKLIEELQEKIAKNPHLRISTLVGRNYAMDRDQHWDRIEKAWRLLVEGKGRVAKDPVQALKAQYQEGITDQFIEPILIKIAGEEPGLIKENDAIIFFNFREDRARQLTKAFVSPEKVSAFKPKKLNNLYFVTMIEYEEGLPARAAFPTEQVKNSLSELISQAGMKQFKVAETEKYAHITYFFNGGREVEIKGETRKLFPSELDHSFNQTPAMKAPEIAEEIINAINSGRYNFILANFANADMLGHTGDLKATVEGIEVVDKVIGEVIKTVLASPGVAIITADHGNAEEMLNIHSGQILTEHSKNPVPFYIVGQNFKLKIPPRGEKEIIGILPDVTATILELLEIPIPPDIEGKSLLRQVIKNA